MSRATPAPLVAPPEDLLGEVTAAAVRADVQCWLDDLPLLRHVDALLAWVGDGRPMPGRGELTDDDLQALSLVVGGEGVADGGPRTPRQWRAGLLWALCEHFGLIAVEDLAVLPGPHQEGWRSPRQPYRAGTRLLVAVAHLEESVRAGRRPEAWADAAARLLLADALCAAAEGPPLGDEGLRQAGRHHFGRHGGIAASRVRAHADELVDLGLLSAPDVVTATGPAGVVLSLAARSLRQLPVARPVAPGAVPVGPTYEVEADVRGSTHRRWRRVRVSGAARAGDLTAVVMDSFGLEPSDHEAGHLLSADADEDDPWTLRVGCAEDGQPVPVVDASEVDVAAVVQHLGGRLVQRCSVLADRRLVEEVVIDLRVIPTTSQQEGERPLVPACLAGGGPDLRPGAPPFDAAVRDADLAREWR